MAITEKQKSEVKKLVVDIMKILDETNDNPKFYEDFFNNMSLKEFQDWIKEFSENNDRFIVYQSEAFNKKKEPTLDRIKKAADYLGIELDEYVYMPFDNPNGSPTRTPYKVPVGYLHIKRLQQMLTKKNKFPINMNQRNMKLNQVVGDSKGSSMTDTECVILKANGCDAVIRELLGPRADDSQAKADMYRAISDKGYVTLAELTNEVENKQALNTANVYLLGAGIISDLVTPGYALINTMKSKKVKESNASKYIK